VHCTQERLGEAEFVKVHGVFFSPGQCRESRIGLLRRA
jgi:hypothetical protein